MATGSEAMKWNLFGDAPHRCWQCGKEPLRIKDVAEHRQYPGAITEFLCKTCSYAHIDARVAKTRQDIGLAQRAD